MIPKKIHILTRDLEILDEETPITKACVCINPQEKITEYTDLSQVWHNSKEEPEKGRLIICIDKHNVSINEWIDQYNCDWLDFAECFGIIIWAYIDDLLPKGGEL